MVIADAPFGIATRAPFRKYIDFVGDRVDRYVGIHGNSIANQRSIPTTSAVVTGGKDIVV